MNQKHGVILVISGPAGSGKGEVVKDLRCHHPDYGYSVSATTRAPRVGEVPDVHYHFYTREQFEKTIAENGLAEYTEYCGNYYGTLRSEIEPELATGRNVILEIEVEGALRIKKAYPSDTVLIMLVPPTQAVQEARLRKRNSETDAVIKKRLARAREEIRYLSQYDYVVVNEDGGIHDTAEQIHAIAVSENCACLRNLHLIDAFLSHTAE